MNNKPFIKLFKTNNKNYIYDVNKNAILSIDKTDYELLDKSMKENIEDYTKLEELNKLYKEGFLSSNRSKEIIHPEDDLITFHLENNIKMITLQVTQQCNFRCEYCVYSGTYLNRSHSSKRMKFSTAAKGIDFLINNSKNNNTICISFYGGEPLLEFDLIKQCIEYAEEKADGKNLIFSMTTNASLLTTEIAQYLNDHNVNLTISLDGPKEIHDKNRKLALNNQGSFDKVIDNVKNIEKNIPEFAKKLLFNAVIDAKNDFCCIDKFFMDYETVKDIGLISSLVTENYKKTSNNFYEDYNCKTQYELFKIFYSLIKNNNIKNCSRIVSKEYNEIVKFSESLITQKMIPEKAHPSGPCIPGVNRLFMTVDGSFYPCEKVSEESKIMNIGHVDTGFNIDKAKKILNIGKVNEESCKNCWAIRFCSICAASLDVAENEFSKKKKEECCRKVKASLEEKFKNYCFLKEFNHRFERKEEMTNFNS